MNVRSIIGLLAAGAVAVSMVGIASPAQASNCRESTWGSSSWSGKKFNCPGGNSMIIRPNVSGQYDDPWSTYKGRDSNGNNYKCKYTSWKSSYKCDPSW